jgi:hypothetical protein
MFITVVVLQVVGHFTSTSAPTQSVAGFFTQVVLDVKHKAVEKDWFPAKRGGALGFGDMVRTGESSFAIIKFTDKSIVKVRERSELTLTSTTSLTKSVELQKGVIGFNIQKQEKNTEFRFTSPTSVASIRGTGGRFAASQRSDTLIVVEGNVLLTNSLSDQSVEVGAGFTGISNADGSIQVRPSTPGERALGEAASTPGDEQNELELDLRDSQGNKKKLKIRYDE